ncbi:MULTISPECIES: Lrp/AsnC family transcriptional regulator [Vibrio oreintalis group]|uniref:Lrp/AsnC family transcriptional regulator n=1 Tax=Vibrio oreintalis group TaxID=1891919 RepID=UPI00148E78A1|nr:Lrp/AsnC family transcriptional regulator [Vibrio europaeus]NOH22496.1 Lrp/AsnC family transcriptional regulator [Vibrio europaeus]
MRTHLKYKGYALDAIDSRLLALLDGNSRVSVAELAREVRMSSPSVNERLKRMEEAGVISGYNIKVSPESFGYPLAAIVRMRQYPGKLKQLETLVASIPEFVECDKVTGDDCLFARLHFRDMAHLDAILDQVAAYADTNTSVIKAAVIERRNVPYQSKGL